VDTSTDGILSIAHPDYPGWYATIDDQPTEILRAYGALAAVAVPAGEHTVRFVYDPLSYRIGAVASLLTWGALGILGVMLLLIRNRASYVHHEPVTGLDRPA